MIYDYYYLIYYLFCQYWTIGIIQKMQQQHVLSLLLDKFNLVHCDKFRESDPTTQVQGCIETSGGNLYLGNMFPIK